MREHEQWFLPEGEGASVPGYLTPESADAMASLLSFQLDRGVRGSLAEIGTFKGRTFVGLAMAARGDEVVAGFDVFPNDIEAGLREALTRLTPEQASRVVVRKQNTMQVTTVQWLTVLRSPARFVHIDGDHTYPAIVNDLQLAACYLSLDGMVVVDDFLHDWYPDVTQGIIDGLRAARDLVPLAIIPRTRTHIQGGSKLICASRVAASHYRDMLRTRYQDRKPDLRTFLGQPVLAFQGF